MAVGTGIVKGRTGSGVLVTSASMKEMNCGPDITETCVLTKTGLPSAPLCSEARTNRAAEPFIQAEVTSKVGLCRSF